MLCPKCEEVDFKFLDDLPQTQQQTIQSVHRWAQHEDTPHYFYYILHDNFINLTLSVEQGCHLCNVIYTVLRLRGAVNNNTPVILRSWSSRERTPFTEKVLARDASFEDIIVTYDGIDIEFGLLRVLKENFSLPSHELGIMLSEVGSGEADSDTGSQTSLKLLKTWLDDCKENHPKCRGPKTPLPTRVIDIGPSGEECQPKLLDTTPGQYGDYIALSHCWGKPELQELTQSWAADPNNLLPLKEWPKTFQQTAEIARALKMRYLWIDNACIKQKDDADFAREAPKMAEYYSGATLVVAAVHAQDSRKGCFVPRNPLLFRPCPIEFKGCQDKTFFISMKLKRASDQAETEPLHSRAWCFQETLLSRRTAAFSWDQLRWSCLQTKASEGNPNGVQIADIPPQAQPLVFLRDFLHRPRRPTRSVTMPTPWWKTMLSKYLLWQPKQLVTMKEAEEIARNPTYQKWYDCVEYFTKRSITYRRDTLPAMSGLARKLHDALGTDDTYYAGLWSGDLVRGLLWAVLSSSNLGKDSDYIAPSWSWASRSGQQISSFFDESIMCDRDMKTSPNWRALLAALEPRNLHVEMKLKQPGGVYGEVTSGTLHCSARLLHGGKVGKLLTSWDSIYARPHPAYHRGHGAFQKDDKIWNWKLTIPAAWAVESSNAAESTEPPQLEGEIAADHYTRYHLASPHKQFHLRNQEVSVLLLWPFKFQDDRCIGIGLVRTDEGKNQYKRVGRVEFVIPYEKLWAWTQSSAEHEEIVIV